MSWIMPDEEHERRVDAKHDACARPVERDGCGGTAFCALFIDRQIHFVDDFFGEQLRIYEIFAISYHVQALGGK